MAAATTTEVEVANQALLFVGNGQLINDFDEVTMEAKACKQYYPRRRDALLESFWWKFATKRAVLADIGSPVSGWTYRYALPADLITPRFIWPGQRMPNAIDKIPFDIESTDTGGGTSGTCLVTDQKAAQLVYTMQCVTVASFSPLFVEALAWDLAVQLCLVLPVKPEWARNAKLEAIAAFNKAGAAQFRGSQQDPNPPSEYTSAR